MKLTARQRRYIRKHSKPPATDRGPDNDELSIIPLLDVVINLVMVLLVLMASALLAREVDAQIPTQGPGNGQAEWRATVVLGASGITVTDAEGIFLYGCETHGTGVTLPLAGGERDWSGLRYCAGQLKAAHPDVTKITLTADPGVPVQDVIRAMDAVRGTDGRPLFPEPQIAAGLR
jgi:hypothetical protein